MVEPRARVLRRRVRIREIRRRLVCKEAVDCLGIRIILHRVFPDGSTAQESTRASLGGEMDVFDEFLDIHACTQNHPR